MVLRLDRLSAYMLFFLHQTLMSIEFVVMKLLHHIPIVNAVATERWFAWTARIYMPKEQYWDSAFKWKMYKLQSRVVKIASLKTARTGKPAPNPTVLHLDGRKDVRLLSFAKGNRPLVLNFGSRSCPPFVEKLREFGEIQKDFADIADFLIVYIEEAHPVEGWMLNNGRIFNHHQNEHDRIKAAQALLQYAPQAHIVADNMNDEAMRAYGALPERFYVVKDGVVVEEGDVGPRGYDPKRVREWLTVYRKTENNNLPQSISHNKPE